MNLKSTYNKIAESWRKDHSSDSWWQEGTDKFLSFLKPGASVLDVGCGAGIKSKYIADRGFKITGIDFSEKMIELATRDCPGVNFDVVDIYELEKYKKKFDAIFAQAVLLHFPKTKIVDILNELKDKLNPEGLLYVAVKEVRADRPEEGIITENDYGYDYDRFFSFFSQEELRKYFNEVGLEILWEGRYSSGKTEWIQIVGRK